MVLIQPNTNQQTLGLTQVHIKGPCDDDLVNGLSEGLDDGLDDLIRGYTARKPDERKEIKVVGEHTTQIIKVLKEFCEALKLDKGTYYLGKFREYLDKTLTDVLTPTDINALFQIMLYEAEDEPKEKWYNDSTSERIGLFTAKLIQLSYNDGNNDFVLITKNSPRIIVYIGYNLRGNKERLIKIKIQGDIADLCHNSSYCEVDVDGDLLYDRVGENRPNYCIFTFKGKIPDYNDNLVRSSSNIYKTTNKETLAKLILKVLHDTHSQVVFINPDGIEEAVFGHTTSANNPVSHFFVNQTYYKFFKQVLHVDDDFLYINNIIVG
ncbi:hypothetical protein HY636_01085 [Candidatus Woesearchaeota archaeon]|nr:hypothetical protein [Candidatus Woesearchaeota archaeon]